MDLGRPDDAPLVVTALGGRRGARPEIVADAARLLRQAMSGPVIDRARRASWLARDVPVAIAVAGAAAEDRLDLLFEEPGGLVVVRLEGGAAEVASPGLPSDVLSRALGRPVLEVLTLSLS